MSDSTPTMLADRAIIRVSGDDVRSFLQGLVTNDTAGPLPVWAGLLTPQGKALFDFLLWEDGADVLIDDTLAVHWSRSGERGVPDPRLPALGRRWIGAPGASAEGWLAHRLSLGVTEGVAELGDGTTLWLECNARELNGVSFAKGCYVGQENTARMHHRAKVNRRLVVAPLGEPGERTRASYPALGLMIELRRIEALGDALIPEWLSTALD